MACGSARVLADQLSGRAPDIRADDLSVFRYLDTHDGHRIAPRPEYI